MIWPVLQPYTVTSRWGWRTRPYGDRGLQFHAGVDLSQLAGSPVMAPFNGYVVESRWDNCTGNTMTVESTDSSGNRIAWWVHHMMDRPIGVNSLIKAGSIIGHVGETGTCSTGPHLHFGMALLAGGTRNGTLIDPIAYANGTFVKDDRGITYSLPNTPGAPVASKPSKPKVLYASVGGGGLGAVIMAVALAAAVWWPSSSTSSKNGNTS